MAFDASRIPADQIAASRQAYRRMTNSRPTGSGVTSDNTVTDPFMRQADGSYRVNPIIHADNQNPWRGNVSVPTFDGGTQRVPYWQADRTFSANLGLTGFNAISGLLSGMQDRFAGLLQQQSNLNFANLGQQTGTDYFRLNDRGRLVRTSSSSSSSSSNGTT